jgi:pimeloyl-ACP methyl ester carboxylesterase
METERSQALLLTGAGVALIALAANGCRDDNGGAIIGEAHDRLELIDTKSFLERVKRDGEFQIASRYWNAAIRMVVGDRSYDLVVNNGSATSFAAASLDGRPDVTIAGPRESWADPGAVLSLVIPSVAQLAHPLTVQGDVIGHVAPYQAAIARLIGLIRETAGGPAGETSIREVERDADAAVGRYLYVKIRDVQYRVYYEEAGKGIPLVLQHTAGSDGRQWRYLIEDTDLQKRFRMIAYDLPFHGKSVPPATIRWWEHEYRLTTDLLMDSIVAIVRGLQLERPVYMGCSIGGYLASDLALAYPDDFRAVIGVNASIAGGAASSRNPSAKTDMAKPISGRQAADSNYHPRVDGQWIGTRMYEITSPVAPEACRRETGWVYSQGGPGVFAGDLYYYTYDHDLSGGRASKIDTSRVDVHFISGEYDPTSVEGPLSMATLAAEIHGSTTAIVKGGSHFAMSDDYPRFREYLMPILDAIHTKYALAP